MKTQAKKLEALITIAQEGGWKELEGFISVDKDLRIQITHPYVDPSCWEREFFDLATILFDHDFIEGLCKGNHEERAFCCFCEAELGERFFCEYCEVEIDPVDAWEIKIKALHSLALKKPEERIDYLYDLFVREE